MSLTAHSSQPSSRRKWIIRINRRGQRKRWAPKEDGCIRERIIPTTCLSSMIITLKCTFCLHALVLLLMAKFCGSPSTCPSFLTEFPAHLSSTKLLVTQCIPKVVVTSFTGVAFFTMRKSVSLNGSCAKNTKSSFHSRFGLLESLVLRCWLPKSTWTKKSDSLTNSNSRPYAWITLILRYQSVGDMYTLERV